MNRFVLYQTGAGSPKNLDFMRVAAIACFIQYYPVSSGFIPVVGKL